MQPDGAAAAYVYGLIDFRRSEAGLDQDVYHVADPEQKEQGSWGAGEQGSKRAGVQGSWGAGERQRRALLGSGDEDIAWVMGLAPGSDLPSSVSRWGRGVSRPRHSDS